MARDAVQVLRIGLRQVEVGEYVRADAGLWGSALLAPLTPPQREHLLAQARPRMAKPDEPLLSARPAPALYLILSGAVVLSTGADGASLTTLGKGDFFGLSSVIGEAPCLAAAADHGGANLAVLPVEAVRGLLPTVPGLQRLLLETARHRAALAASCGEFLDRW